MKLGTFAEFLAERCIVSPEEWAQTSALRRAYSGWCEEAGQRALNWLVITGRLREHGCSPASRKVGGTPKRGWRGSARGDAGFVKRARRIRWLAARAVLRLLSGAGAPRSAVYVVWAVCGPVYRAGACAPGGAGPGVTPHTSNHTSRQREHARA